MDDKSTNSSKKLISQPNQNQSMIVNRIPTQITPENSAGLVG